MASYQIKHYLPKGEPDRAWTARTYARILKCSAAIVVSEGLELEAFKSELAVLKRVLAACDISLDQAEKELEIYKRTRRMRNEAARTAALEASKNF